MRRSFKVRVGLISVIVGAVSLAALPASASTGTAALDGSLSISPGITVSGGAQTFTMSATGVIVTDTVQGSIGCSLSGNDVIGSYASGSGSFSGSCSTSAGTSSMTGTFTRGGIVIVAAGAICGAGICANYNATCTLTPTGSITITPLPPTITQSIISCVIVLRV